MREPPCAGPWGWVADQFFGLPYVISEVINKLTGVAMFSALFLNYRLYCDHWYCSLCCQKSHVPRSVPIWIVCSSSYSCVNLQKLLALDECACSFQAALQDCF